MSFSPTITTMVSTGASVLVAGVTMLINHVVVATRQGMRLTQIEKDIAEIKGVTATLPSNYVPRRELEAILEGMSGSLRRVEGNMQRIEDLLNTLLTK